MLTIKDLMNPNIKDKESEMELMEYTCLQEIDLEDFGHVIHEYVNVVDEKHNLVGAVKTERLKYLISKQRENLLTQVLDTMKTGFVAIDRDSRIFYVNHAYGNILNLNISKILGRYLSIIEPEATLLNVLKTKQSQHVNNQFIKSISTYVDINTYPLMDGDEMVGAYSIFTDVTDVNELHKEVKRISAVAEEYGKQVEAEKFLEKNKIIGKSKIYLDCVNKALKVANTDMMVLLRGENGTGKEIIANVIKSNCARKNKPFITVNCSAIPESLIESELFGYEEGAFSGASKGGKMGKFQLADGGTLFMDEIGDMPYQMQAKLLRALQEGEIEKVGRQNNIPIDVRVIAATNKPIEKMVKEGTFREDLYYRLNVVSIYIPALRERANDILLLSDYFLEKYCKKYDRYLKIDKAVYQTFLAYDWPGNVRELQNTIESAVVLCDRDLIMLDDLPENMQTKNIKNVMKLPDSKKYIMQFDTLKEEVENFEKNVILQTVNYFDGDKHKAMELLGLPKRTFYRKIAKFGTEIE
ncbi:sigma 54-interacting transcriptional regulator [Sedimentibacter sp.]|uniref:sigma-54 interaction domain-containing protein n=1 Tax=Sedimentibacter sp. TaxID=1960295 RepID=UPI0028AE9143|nr:sigma 54-interacting transcriptional regulator [Sedimentibacter sp.]